MLGGMVMKTYRCRNTRPTSGSFDMDGLEQIALFQEIHNQGWEVGAFYHSHPTIEPVPSSVDVSYAQAWPDVLWIIVGWRYSYRYLGNKKWKAEREGPPDVWTWRIEGERVFTSELAIQ